MESRKDFFDKQYETLHADESRALDHPLYRFFLPFAKTRSDIVIDWLGNSRFANVLDLGCGTCPVLAAKQSSFSNYTGLDISSYQLSQVSPETANRPGVTLREWDLNQPLDLKDTSYDLIISLSTIEYLLDPEKFLKEIHRLLKDEGTLILHTMNLAFLLRRIQLFLGKLPTYNRSPGWEGGIVHRFTFPEMQQLLERNGFHVLQKGCAGLSPSLRMWWPNLLASDMVFKCQKK